MRFLSFCLFLLLFVSARGQTNGDTLSGMDVLYQQSLQQNKHKADSLKADSTYIAHHRFGCAIYGGIGTGGNSYYNGIAYGTGASVHYKMHTINMYATLATKSEIILGQNDKSTVLNSNNYGFMYGLGAYGKHFSASGGIGIGYNKTNMVLSSGFHLDPKLNENVPTLINVNYSKVGACIGVQATVGGKFIRLTTQFYVNISNTITNYTILGGLVMVIK